MTRRNQRSAEAARYRPLYNTKRWAITREAQLTSQPLCEEHLKRGRCILATVCHHIDPKKKADPATFYEGPFASLCAACHDGPIQSEERRGYSTEIGVDGFPVDPRHPANRQRA